ncbi:hypothetical protein ACFWFR_09285 [Oerskovia sp. NPDC060287]|uniref:hypothetical protein n=1 Tax=Oerskovia sp. NPDC060287 TaxID=3347095 RepID=UPI0036478077
MNARRPGDSTSADPLAGSPFAEQLTRERDHFNAVLARAVALGADRDDVAAAVRELRPVVDGLAPALDGEELAGVVDALVSTAARCVAARRWRSGSVERWAVLALTPQVLPWLRAAPAVTVAALADAARQVAVRGDLTGWGRRVSAAAVATGVLSSGPRTAPGATSIRDTVLVAAWRSGLVRYRRAALRAAASLPYPVAAAALDLAPGTDVGAVVERHASDPWWWPGQDMAASHGAPSTVSRFGGFRGFGGPWLTLPLVVGPLPGEPGLLWAVRTARPQAEDWTLVCDVHGWAALRAAPGAEERPAPGTTDRTPPAGVPWLDDVTGQASTLTLSTHLTLVSREHSYSIDLVRVPR